MASDRITVSVVSHRQGGLVRNLLADLQQHCARAVTVILTVNVDEELPFQAGDFGFPLRVKRNPEPKGFGANHNAAFGIAETDYFCVLNPDIRLRDNPFPRLLEALQDRHVGVVAPKIVNAQEVTEDSARRFPTLSSLAKKALGLARRLDYEVGDSPFHPDWVAGMFMLLRADAFRRVGGFDERYFLYYEDVDLCARLRRAGYDIRVEPAVRVVHDARRDSRRNVRYMARHLSSIFRYFLTGPRNLPPLS